jgi:hypothetical protein
MTSKTSQIEKDAKGQFAPSQGDRNNNGLASATPRAVTGKDDATLENASRKTRPKAGFDESSGDNRRN